VADKLIKPSAAWMELCLSNYFGPRQNVVVPRVSWGLHGEYEKDLVVLYPSGWATEVEIKISVSDLRADQKKSHGHDSCLMQKLYFAIPSGIYNDDTLALIPERAGVLVVDQVVEEPLVNWGYSPDYTWGTRVRKVRSPQVNKSARKLSEYERQVVMRLGYLRFWSLAEKKFETQFVELKGGLQ